MKSILCSYHIVSTGGTASALEKAGVTVTKVENITNFPEMVNFIILCFLTSTLSEFCFLFFTCYLQL